MPPNPLTTDPDTLLSTCLRLPQHVVHRGFVAETVVLNLQTGKYHGLNPVGGRMLEVVNEAPTVSRAAELIAEEYGQDPGAIEADLVAFCRDLLDRGLLEAAGP
jgi:Coenzyme PQQ synthesis protein D (PqqD)